MRHVTGAELYGREQAERETWLASLTKLLTTRVGQDEAAALTAPLVKADSERLKRLFDLALTSPVEELRREIQGSP
jgi:hypothetical protein